jgi:hypothetical protein
VITGIYTHVTHDLFFYYFDLDMVVTFEDINQIIMTIMMIINRHNFNKELRPTKNF